MARKAESMGEVQRGIKRARGETMTEETTLAALRLNVKLATELEARTLMAKQFCN